MRERVSRPTILGTIAGMAGLIGVLPTLLTLGLAQHFSSLGAFPLTIIHICFMVVGVWLFTAIFGD